MPQAKRKAERPCPCANPAWHGLGSASVKLLLERLPADSPLLVGIEAPSAPQFAAQIEKAIANGTIGPAAAAEAAFSCVCDPILLRPLSNAHFQQAALQLMDVFRLHKDAMWLGALADETRYRLDFEKQQAEECAAAAAEHACTAAAAEHQLNSEHRPNIEGGAALTWLAELAFAIGQGYKDQPWTIYMATAIEAKLASASLSSLAAAVLKLQTSPVWTVKTLAARVLQRLTELFECSQTATTLSPLSLFELFSMVWRFVHARVICTSALPASLHRMLTSRLAAASWPHTFQMLCRMHEMSHVLGDAISAQVAALCLSEHRQQIEQLEFGALCKTAAVLARSNMLPRELLEVITAAAQQRVKDGALDKLKQPRCLGLWATHASEAGIADESIFVALCSAALRTLQKVPALAILRICSELAAAGVRDNAFFHQAAALIDQRIATNSHKQDAIFGKNLEAVEQLKTGCFTAQCEGPMMLTCKIACSIPKAWKIDSQHGRFVQAAQLQLAFTEQRPLCVDVGCAQGKFVIGLAAADRENRCNHIGIELSEYMARMGQGIIQRWGLKHKAQLLTGRAEEVMGGLAAQCAGQAAVVFVHFPTPFAREVASGGNQQLPTQREGFMLSTRLVDSVAQVLRPDGGIVFAQTQVEDVAIAIRALFEAHPSLCVASTSQCELLAGVIGQLPKGCVSSAASDVAVETSRSKRSTEYVASGGLRAEGDGWLTSSAWARCCSVRSEMEVSCERDNLRVYRIAFSRR